MISESSPLDDYDTPDEFGRTKYDILVMKPVWIVLALILLAITIYLLWDTIITIPIYAFSAIILSFFWYAPIHQWLSSNGSFVEVWDKKTNTFTTWRIGKDALADFDRIGVTNTVYSIAGSPRIFASYLDPEEGVLETSWVHDLDPWSYHRDLRTLSRLTERVAEVMDDVINSNALSQIEGRRHAMNVMQKHYSQLDDLFFGSPEVNSHVEPTETRQGDTEL